MPCLNNYIPKTFLSIGYNGKRLCVRAAFLNRTLYLTTKFDMEKTLDNTTEPQHDAKLPVMRCGSCLFAQGGDEFKFRNGETNYRYECTLRSRNGNIVFLDSQSEHYRWHNQKACENFEGAGKSLKKRTDLDHTKFDFLSDGHFEVLP